MYPAVYAFDVDDTLAIPNGPFPGPITLDMLVQLRLQSNPVGLCGNFLNAFKYAPDIWKIISFYGPEELLGTSLVAHHQYKHFQLLRVAKIMKANRYVMVGNRQGDPKVRPGSQDNVQAKLAKWEFIDETSFSKGVR